MATDALLDGFEETRWIDSDVGFHPDSVERLRAHPQPLVCGVYPQKGKRARACHIMPGTPSMVCALRASTLARTTHLTGWKPIPLPHVPVLQQAHRGEGVRLAQAAARFDTFLGRCWDIRQRVIPMRAVGMVEALQQVAEAGLEPELVSLAGDAAVDETQHQLTCVLDLFPEAVVVGDEAQREEVRRVLEAIARDRNIHCQGYGPAWRFLPQHPATSS